MEKLAEAPFSPSLFALRALMIAVCPLGFLHISFDFFCSLVFHIFPVVLDLIVCVCVVLVCFTTISSARRSAAAGVTVVRSY